MDSFNLSRMKDYLPNIPQLPKNLQLPSLPHLPGLQSPMASPGLAPADMASHEIPATTTSTSDQPMSALDPRPISPEPSTPLTNLNLINQCDSFPYLHTNPDLYLRQTSSYYHLLVPEHPGICLGYILPSVALLFSDLPDWTLDTNERTLTLLAGPTAAIRTAAVAKTISAMRHLDHFAVLRGWRDELYAIYGPGRTHLFSIERSASALLGVVTYGCHLTAYQRDESTGNLRLWIPRRAATKQTYPSALDNTVAGGIAEGEEPLACIVREAEEEASLPEMLVRERVRAAGVVSYFHVRDARAGGEEGLLQPEVQYVYDLDLTGAEGVTPAPRDGEVEGFTLMSVEEVRVAMAAGEFKPNCALVLLDFFVRHGMLTPENEGDYVEIVSRLRRVLEFPTK